MLLLDSLGENDREGREREERIHCRKGPRLDGRSTQRH